MTTSTRPCLILRDYSEPIKGKFHRWGNEVVYDDGNQPHDRTIGIVEVESGEVRQVTPREIQFTD